MSQTATHERFARTARQVYDGCKDLTGAAAGYIALLSADSTHHEILFYDTGALSCEVDSTVVAPIRGLRGQMYRTGKAVVENDFARSEWAGLLPEGHLPLDSVLFAPLMYEGKALGLLGLSNKPGGFTAEDARLAEAFAGAIAAALGHCRRLESAANQL